MARESQAGATTIFSSAVGSHELTIIYLDDDRQRHNALCTAADRNEDIGHGLL